MQMPINDASDLYILKLKILQAPKIYINEKLSDGISGLIWIHCQFLLSTHIYSRYDYIGHFAYLIKDYLKETGLHDFRANFYTSRWRINIPSY